ncbi:MAG TPA: hypothetical protein VEK11_00970 [Thermoanaerobaculia bacterium]|nr:hypothetical protein [Thermoanaerobaculia bacterium]
MTVIARKVTAIPARAATESWQRIIDLVAPSNAAAQAELASVAGVASSLIADEAMKSSPIIVTGDGPRLRIYCLYGEDAIEGAKTNESSIPDSPAENGGGWKMSLPCPSDDLEWVRASLKKRSARISARDLSETTLPDETAEETSTSAQAASINMESFLRP